MARNKKTYHDHSTDTLHLQVTNDEVEEHTVQTLNAEGQPEGFETSTAPEAGNTINVPSEMAQEIWESLREEFYERESSRSDRLITNLDSTKRSSSYHYHYIGRSLSSESKTERFRVMSSSHGPADNSYPHGQPVKLNSCPQFGLTLDFGSQFKSMLKHLPMDIILTPLLE
jgi:hypothetical protein